jgi:hypothetical protein
VPNTLEILHFITKPVVDAAFLQDWLAFLSQEQEFSVHLFYAPQAFEDLGSDTLPDLFPQVQLHRIEKVSPHPASRQGAVFLADYLDLKYLSQSVYPSLIHTHDSRSLLLARYFFSEFPRLHSWWMEDRTAHRYWRALVERMAHWRTWETVEADMEETPQVLSPLLSRQFPLPTPMTLDGEYRRGKAFTTLREVYRSILRATELRPRS